MNPAEWITLFIGIPVITAASLGAGLLFYASVRPWLTNPPLPVPAPWIKAGAVASAVAFAGLCLAIGLDIWPRP